MVKMSIGWVAISRIAAARPETPLHKALAGHQSPKVYGSRGKAIASQRSYKETNEDVLAKYHIQEAFVEVDTDV
jgi:hypothetical protein